MEYIKELAKRLIKMIEANEKQKRGFEQVNKKLNDVGFWDNREEWNRRFSSLTQNQKEIYYKGEKIYPKSAIRRVRIELNKALIEWEK